ncbi:MAG: SidA/IucD/PvdA family monooxygenase [Bacteroidales bacterium]|nr:SidA/IucD/PvdA family monooxygenase [Bacteroidales bacterium]
MNKYFFIGVAGVGMSAIAQYLANTGNIVYGSDRLFVTEPNHKVRQQLEAENIKTFVQGEAKIEIDTDFVVVSTAIEPTVPEYKQALDLNIPVIHRSEMLKKITQSKKTIAIAGTSGKSSTTAILYTILHENGFCPSMLNGSGLASLQKNGKIGNAAVGKGDWLVIEADESDGTLVNYTPEIGLILNIDRDHKEFEELEKIFGQFASQVTEQLIVNLANERSKKFSNGSKYDFGTTKTDFFAENISQKAEGLYFSIKNVDFFIPAIGLHNVENATSAISIANYLGISLEDIASALKEYAGIDRRMQILGSKNGITFIDDYAHNPAKIESAIKTAQVLGNRVFAFFQPHGFTPLKFMKDELIEKLQNTMRAEDEFYLSEVFYAGGTVSKTITSDDVVEEIKTKNINAYLSQPRDNFALQIKDKLQSGDIILLMGARDPSLGKFAEGQYLEL